MINKYYEGLAKVEGLEIVLLRRDLTTNTMVIGYTLHDEKFETTANYDAIKSVDDAYRLLLIHTANIR